MYTVSRSGQSFMISIFGCEGQIDLNFCGKQTRDRKTTHQLSST